MREFFKGFKKGSTLFGENMALIINSALLSVVYIVGVGVTAIIAKIAGKKFLDLGLNKKSETYWTDLNIKKKPKENYYRQF